MFEDHRQRGIVRSRVGWVIAAAVLAVGAWAPLVRGDALAERWGAEKADGRVVGSLPFAAGGVIDLPIGGDVGPIGGGGTYEGPGDTVPPGEGNPSIGMCTMYLPPDGCVTGPMCDQGWSWTEDAPRCVWPQFGGPDGEPLLAQGFMLTIWDLMEMYQLGRSCTDQYGNLTACISAPFDVHEIHVFQSGWINGYDDAAPISEAVAAQVCVGGDFLVAGWSFEEVSQSLLCEAPTVCVTFNAACLEAALQDWAASGIDLNAWGDSWILYVDFVSCEPCDE